MDTEVIITLIDRYGIWIFIVLVFIAFMWREGWPFIKERLNRAEVEKLKDLEIRRQERQEEKKERLLEKDEFLRTLAEAQKTIDGFRVVIQEDNQRREQESEATIEALTNIFKHVQYQTNQTKTLTNLIKELNGNRS